MTEPDLASRTASIERSTTETSVHVELALDAPTAFDHDTGIGFLDHMLDLFAKHGGFDLKVRCEGDLHVDDHHTTEDIGIALGQAFRQALGKKEHVARYGHCYVPMDDALARAVVDLSGRFFLHFDAPFSREQVGNLSTEMISHFWRSFAEHAACNLHVTLLHGENAHHQIEAIFKAVARALRAAAQRDATFDEVASTKGTI